MANTTDIDIEELTDSELEQMAERYRKIRARCEPFNGDSSKQPTGKERWSAGKGEQPRTDVPAGPMTPPAG